ncbi:hypothetical protein MP228_002774 [Amoeboaphelidium protococcarum]|nr:hypothetical protein MP228_002774 [Amoeboaphelidium protococcarum]
MLDQRAEGPLQVQNPGQNASNIPNLTLVQTIRHHQRSISCVKFSPCGEFLACSSADSQVSVWWTNFGFEDEESHSDQWQLFATLHGHSDGVNDLAWSRDSKLVATASDDKTCVLWTINNQKQLLKLYGHTSYVFCVNFSPRSNMIVTGSFDETVRIWDAQSGKCIRNLDVHSEPICSVEFSSDSTLVMSASFDGLIRLFDTQSGQCLKTIGFESTSKRPVLNASFSPNSKFILASYKGESIKLLDYYASRVVKQFSKCANRKFCLFKSFFNYQGSSYVVSGSEDGKLCIWNLDDQSLALSCKAHDDVVIAATVNEKKRVIATGSLEKDCSMKIWVMN